MKIWLAPLHGITNYMFRNSLYRHFGGIDYCVTPFLPVQEMAKLNVKNWKDIWPKNNTTLPTVPQLMGNKPSHFVDTMRAVHDEYGYDAFNWNIGCPVAQVVRRRRGCGIMPDPDTVEEVVRTVTSQTPYRFSVKMRLGLKDPAEGLRILERLDDYPLDFIVIHPRLGEQMYDGVPDLEQMDIFYRHTRHRIIYSGDLFSAQDYERLQNRYPGIEDWMLGRGLLQNPFLAEQLKGEDTGDRRQRFSKYYQKWTQEMLDAVKEKSTLAKLKELWHYYACLFQLPSDALQQLLRINDFDAFYDRTLDILKEG
ncbi:MAG: tRNA-dihydrouridine synthase family protein [Bacteroidales bacterium]|nr:tRNA-dihydrouridine synthase family protein [Bacteroidales bacterium]